jgi:hypothetical protein
VGAIGLLGTVLGVISAGHCDAGLREHRGGSAGYWRCADSDRSRAGGGHSRGLRVQHLREPYQSTRQ